MREMSVEIFSIGRSQQKLFVDFFTFCLLQWLKARTLKSNASSNKSPEIRHRFTEAQEGLFKSFADVLFNLSHCTGDELDVYRSNGPNYITLGLIQALLHV